MSVKEFNFSLLRRICGRYTRFSKMKIAVSHVEKIDIGKNTILAPGVLIYDHDHKYGIYGVKKHEFVNSPIKIGENCWIGAYSVILRGSSIGDNCVIAAHSVVKGNVPDGSVYIQKRETVLIKKSDAEENT